MGIIKLLKIIRKYEDKKLKLPFNKKDILSWPVILAGTILFIFLILYGFLQINNNTLIMIILNIFLVCILSILTVTDIRRNIIPNKILGVLLLSWSLIVFCSMIFSFEEGLHFLFSSLTGGLIGGLIFLLCYFLSKKQLGAGDVKLVFIIGLFVTGQCIIGCIFYGVVLCCFFSIVQLLRKKIGVKDGVPLVPFLYIGTVITLLIQ